MAMNGQIFTGGGGRIVGPEYDALKLRDVLNDLDLQVAFVDDLEIQAAQIYTREMMQQVGVEHPVIAMPASVREQWLNDPEIPAHLLVVYTGELPTHGRRSSFGIVRPGDRRG